MRKQAQTKAAKLQSQADRLFQVGMLEKYPRSVISGQIAQVIHHFIPKSVSNRLRYDEKNGISLTNAEHCRLHQSPDPEIESRIIQIKGKKWLDYILKSKHQLIKTDVVYYEQVIRHLEKLVV